MSEAIPFGEDGWRVAAGVFAPAQCQWRHTLSHPDILKRSERSDAVGKATR